MSIDFFPTDVNGRKVRVFQLSEDFLEAYKTTTPNWGPVGYITYKRTYARTLEDGTSEEWWQTCRRVVEGTFNVQKIHCKRLGTAWEEPKAQKSAQDMYDRMFNFKFLPPGRGIWTMGTDLVYEKGSACLNNCGFVSTQNINIDFAGPFTFLMDMSMLGVGIGGDTKGAGKAKIQIPRYTDEPYVVADSREGWVDLIKTVLNSFVGKGAYPKTIDYSKVRPFGAPIRGFGGVASGPDPLDDIVQRITALLMPNEETGSTYRINSTKIVEIFNLIGRCVVAGNVRRTAEIMFGAPDDEEFAELKNSEQLDAWYAEQANFEEGTNEWQALQDKIDEHPLRTHRWASNNSVFAKVGMDYSKAAERICDNGEPGLVWLDAMQKYGRLADPPNWKDKRAMGSNPCSEQTLESWELCCLVETFPAHHDSLEDYKNTLKAAYLYAKTVTLIPTHDPRSNAVIMRNRRIGCSMSGIIQAINKLGRSEFYKWCDEGYAHVQHLDEIYSSWLGIPLSIKTTSVKPSGTVSLLCGATPGIHYPHSEYYIRRITFQKGSPLLDACRQAGYKVEESVYGQKGNSYVVEFPVHETNFKKSKDDITIWEQFANAAALQKWWADNQVSITVTFRKEEADDVQTCIEVYQDQLKSISLLPLSEHGYAQAPYETITQEQFEDMTSNLLPLSLTVDAHDTDDKFCSGETCMISLD